MKKESQNFKKKQNICKQFESFKNLKKSDSQKKLSCEKLKKSYDRKRDKLKKKSIEKKSQ